MADFVMLIKRVGDQLEMKLDSENPANEQETRRNSNSASGGGKRNNKIKNERRKRRKRENPSHELSHASGVHQTMILSDSTSDTVVFKADASLAVPFVVDVEFDDQYLGDTQDEPTRSPFGWATPRTSEKATTGPHSGSHIVTGAFKDVGSAGNKPTDYLFYKATVWADGLKLDPDFFCDR